MDVDMNKNIENPKNIIIKKASGETEIFDEQKLIQSLVNAGTEKKTISKIVADINNWIYPGVSTKEIYSRAFKLLQKNKHIASVRYKLKQAIFQFGPTGYPFEHFIGQVLERQGFKTEVGVIAEGFCVSHEIDVIANKNNKQHIIECKYSQNQGKYVSIQVPLYVRARVDDIIKKRKSLQDFNDISFAGWVVTNTRFSSESTQYGKCTDLQLLAWDYPEGNGLKDIIEREKIFPVTILHHLKKQHKEILLEQGIVTCRQLLNSMETLKSLHLKPKKFELLLAELNDICS